ncbi:hypothetical protein APSETT445_007233 [Aspergillus pseudonomiae]
MMMGDHGPLPKPQDIPTTKEPKGGKKNGTSTDDISSTEVVLLDTCVAPKLVHANTDDEGTVHINDDGYLTCFSRKGDKHLPPAPMDVPSAKSLKDIALTQVARLARLARLAHIVYFARLEQSTLSWNIVEGQADRAF